MHILICPIFSIFIFHIDIDICARRPLAAVAAAAVADADVEILSIAAGSVVVTAEITFPAGQAAMADTYAAAPSLAGASLTAKYGAVTVAVISAPPPTMAPSLGTVNNHR